ncbi:MAG: Holliday junction resolvase RuvX [Candidatus Kerfeldbacteria bacterium]|nr:Holliday junction resolvase RuvX [Candidatus Kerfeldbacteria bacterium]
MRVLGIDVGEKKIGLAVGDSGSKFVFARPPLFVRNWGMTWPILQRLCDHDAIDTILVGWPLNSKGQATAQTKTVGQFVAQLKTTINLPVETIDERHSTQAVKREQQGRKLARGQEDSLAAQLLVEAWLAKQS